MRSKFTLTALLVIILYACGDHKVDVSNVKAPFKTHDFYLDFMQFDTTDCERQVEVLSQKYPDFFNFYTDTLMDVGNIDTIDRDLCGKLSFLRNNKDLKLLADSVIAQYPDTRKPTVDLKNLFKHIKFYLPDWPVPDVYYFDGGLRLWSVVIYKDYIAIGLDMFLGREFPYYSSRQIPAYMAERFEPSQIAVQAGKAIYQDISKLDVNSAKDFLQMMIESGKEVLFLEYVLPDRETCELFSLSEQKYQWLESNEAEIYNYFITHDMIYSTIMKDNIKYIQEAPYSPGMPTESPGKTGVYIGYKILKEYMEKTDSDLMTTLRNTDYREIFEQSGYKPL